MKVPAGKAMAIVALVALCCLSACKHMKFEPPAQAALEDVFANPNTSNDADLLCRLMPAYLDELDAMMKKNKYDLQAVFKASGAHFGYAFSCLEDTDKKAAMETYLRGRDLALAELRRYSFFDQSFDDSLSQFKKALAYNFDKRNIQPLYWAAMNWFFLTTLDLNAQGSKEALQKAAAMLEFVAGIDGGYGNGTTYAVLGSIHAILEEGEGGDVELAKQEFENAALYSGNSLLAINVLKARWLATRLKDRAMFESLLREVLSTPTDQFPDKTFVNVVARRKAQLLLENRRLFFPEG